MAVGGAVGGQDEHGHEGVGGEESVDAVQYGEAVEVRHAEVEQHDVGLDRG